MPQTFPNYSDLAVDRVYQHRTDPMQPKLDGYLVCLTPNYRSPHGTFALIHHITPYSHDELIYYNSNPDKYGHFSNTKPV